MPMKTKSPVIVDSDYRVNLVGVYLDSCNLGLRTSKVYLVRSLQV